MAFSFRTFHMAALAMAVGVLPNPPLPARGCGAAPPPGAHVGIAGEEALIVWNPATHTEQFIRRASFEGQAPQFGFLVPTPSPPRLSETYASVFQSLGQTYRPRFVPRSQYGLELSSVTGLLFPTFAGAKGRAAATQAVTAERVSVLDSEQVAGYDAVVLRADDPTALAQWLRAHGYAARPALSAWLKPYVARHWAVTAFKMTKPDAGQPRLSSATVQMSFTTDQPFFPYSEPADQRDGTQGTAGRLLRIYCVGPARMDGTLDSTTVRWPGRARWAEPLPTLPADKPFVTVRNPQGNAGSRPEWMPVPQSTPDEGIVSMSRVYDDRLPQTLWLTVFEDKSSPRPGVADLYFSQSAQQTPLVPTVFWPKDRRFPVPIEFVIAAGVFAVSKWRKRQEKQRHIAVSGGSPQAPSTSALL